MKSGRKTKLASKLGLPRESLRAAASLNFLVHALLKAVIALVDDVEAVLQSGQHTGCCRPECDRFALKTPHTNKNQLYLTDITDECKSYLKINRTQIAAQIQCTRSCRIVQAIRGGYHRRRRCRSAVIQFGARVEVPLQGVDLAEQNVLERFDLVDFLAQTAISSLQAAAAGRRQCHRLQRYGAAMSAQRRLAMDVVIVVIVVIVGDVRGLCDGNVLELFETDRNPAGVTRVLYLRCRTAELQSSLTCPRACRRVNTTHSCSPRHRCGSHRTRDSKRDQEAHM